jgi:hypothetical protein
VVCSYYSNLLRPPGHCIVFGFSFIDVLRIFMYQIWDGDLFLFNVETADEALEQSEAGFQIELEAYYGA